MPIERFSKTEFEQALPAHWQYLGYLREEHCYLYPIDARTGVHIRSSIGWNGYAKPSAEDSIRLVLVEKIPDDFAELEYIWQPLSTKIDTYTTRVIGWQKRMLAKIDILKSWRLLAGDCHGNPRHIFRAHTLQNDGRILAKCMICNRFSWLD